MYRADAFISLVLQFGFETRFGVRFGLALACISGSGSPPVE
jgi:hypothetical protein